MIRTVLRTTLQSIVQFNKKPVIKLTNDRMRNDNIILNKAIQAHVVDRYYSNKSNYTAEDMTANFSYVKNATNDDKILIIDVREPDEVKEYGAIPNSVNIPLGNISQVFSNMSDKEFENTFKRNKPTEETEVICYCMIGKRSGMAQKNLLNLGYKNVKNYLGSFTDWARKTT